jgi:hypothetical protein
MYQANFGSAAGSRKISRFARNDRFRVAVIPNPSAALRINSERDLAKLNNHRRASGGARPVILNSSGTIERMHSIQSESVTLANAIRFEFYRLRCEQLVLLCQ